MFSLAYDDQCWNDCLGFVVRKNVIYYDKYCAVGKRAIK
ncbi:hypothetical protein SP41_52 [Salmonella phage 41]|nr:hypothetical protein SP41_52 [Salmonella phage 41]